MVTNQHTLTPTALDEGKIQEFRSSLRGSLLRPGDSDYDAARKVWNGMIDRRPLLIARCHDVADVMQAVTLRPGRTVFRWPSAGEATT